MSHSSTSRSTSIIVVGASGRMGLRIVSLALDDARFDVRACVTHDESPRIGQTIAMPSDARTRPMLALQSTRKTIENAGIFDCIVDFSADAAVSSTIAIARAGHAAILIGTTALSSESIAALRDEARHRPVLIAPNTSLGVTVAIDLVQRACRLLGENFRCSIVEAHHSAKKDAPSGTALRFASAVRETGHALSDDQILAMRGGDVIGEHTIRLAGLGEYIEITHRATTRDLFARGALHCAAWLRGKPAGWYTMNDVLGLSAQS